ncbi:MAG: hypothetical protein N3C12_07765 [Candidatus Binatia bacterium]|nr:hypothetical protein [Candidatus Binatia bacterium]
MGQRWWSFAVVLVAVGTLAGRVAARDPVPVRDKSGKVWAEVVVCNDCKNPGEANCFDGAESGWLNGRPCGKCFVDKNYGKLVPVPYDVHFVGTLVDSQGAPVKDRFVKLFVQNGWGHRTATRPDGQFRIIIGAVGDRKSNEPIVVDLGRIVDQQKDSNDRYFALFLLAPDHTPCDPQ